MSIWIALASGKRPDYNKKVFLYDEKATTEPFGFGELREIIENPDGRQCKFCTGNSGSGEEVIESRFTHFMLPNPPKSK